MLVEAVPAQAIGLASVQRRGVKRGYRSIRLRDALRASGTSHHTTAETCADCGVRNFWCDMESNEMKSVEQFARRAASRLGLRLAKSRSRDGYTPLHHSGPRYMVSNERNIVVDYGSDLLPLIERCRKTVGK